MDAKLKERISLEINEYEAMAKKYFNKEINLKEFKHFSGGYGSYGERGGTSLMLRLRMNQGRLTKEKLAFVIAKCEQYQVKHIHFTTCQTIQLHGLSIEAAVNIMREALDHDIICRGGGGDFPRNVMASPLSGVAIDETFDVMPYASQVSDYLVSILHDLKLPRKLKVAFNNSQTNDVHATFRDLGFVAKENGLFDVYCAGGLGQNPRLGVKVAEDVKGTEVLYYVDAMINLFLEHGNYVNRAKARTRYMQETLGVEGLKAEFNKHLEKAYTKNLNFLVEEELVSKVGNDKETNNWRVISEKYSGLYAVMFHPIAGDIELSDLKRVYETVKDLEAVELRIGPDQNVYVINLAGKEVEAVLACTEFGAQNFFETSVSCVGATVCQVGLRDSHGLLVDLVAGLRPYNFSLASLPRIHISGCPSSCGTQQIGKFGFQGSFRLVDKKTYPAFIFSYNGNDTLTKERFGDICGNILQEDVLKFMVEIGTMVEKSTKDFDLWLKDNLDTFKIILGKYLEVKA